MQLLKEIYYGKGPAAFATQKRLYQVAKERDPTMTYKTVLNFLLKQPSYQLHRQPAKRVQYPHGVSKRFTMVNHVGVLSVDVMVLSKFKSKYNFALVMTDCLTRYLMVSFMRKLNASTTLDALLRALKQQYKFELQTIYSDDGVEFKSVFQQYLNDNNIKHVYAQPLSPHHTGYSEKVR